MLTLTNSEVAIHPEILTGITSSPKKISSWYFYDDRGSRLFETITRLSEYYLTKSETEIFNAQANAMVASFKQKDAKFINLVELGAGDGVKTKILLNELQNEGMPFLYSPIDISGEALNMLEKNIREDLPDVRINKMKGDYFQQLDAIGQLNHGPKIILFLGSSIGNYTHAEAIAFLKQIRAEMGPTDQLMIGFDLVKDAEIILNAYNDKSGVTRDFNLNLLTRMNDEFEADFMVDDFQHCAVYDPVKQAALSYLISTKNQQVYFKATDTRISFKAWEPIHTETSQKYTRASITHLAKEAGLIAKQWFTDEKAYFADVIFEPKN